MAPGGSTGGQDPPERRIGLSGGGSLTINNGSTAAMQFTVTETHVATPITFDVSGLPSGVTATFTPPSLPHPTRSQNVSLKLTAAATALSSNATLQVEAASGGLSDSRTVNLTVLSPFSIVPGAPVLPIGFKGELIEISGKQVKLAPFGNVTVPLNLQIANGVRGPISLVVTNGLPTGVTAQFNPANLAAPSQGGSVVADLTLTAGNVTAKTVRVTVGARVGGAESSAVTFPLVIVAPFVSGISPSAGTVPMFQQPGTAVTIFGGGFGPGTTVTFGTDSPVPASSVAGDGTSLVAMVPPTAASGTLTVTSPAGVASGGNFTIDNYRNTRGYSWQNSDQFQTMVGGTYSYADATALFGASQTVLNVFPGVNVLAPFVDAFLGAVDVCLDSNGQCFGMTQTSLQFATGMRALSNFSQQPAGVVEPGGPVGPDVWTLNGPPFGSGMNVSPALSALIHQQHMAQFSQESINNWVGFHVSVTSAAGLRAAILRAFAAGGQNGVGAMIALNPSLGSGHVVVAFEVIDTGGGNFDILAYNPNVQFVTGEDSNTKTRADNTTASVINVMSNGDWHFSELGWDGDIHGITVIPWNTIPLVPTFPMAEVLAAFGTAGALVGVLMIFVAGAAEITQIGDAQGHRLLADGGLNTDRTTMLSGVRPMSALGGLGKKSIPAFVGNRQDALTHTITGNADGSYTATSMRQGVVATLAGIPTSPGAADGVSIHEGEVSFTGSAGKPVTLSLLGVGKTSKLPRRATLRTVASARAAISFSFDPAAEIFRYVHEGAPANHILELSSFDASGQATKFVTPSTRVTGGDILTFRPDWNQLVKGAGTVNVRTAKGESTSRPLE